MFHIIRSIYVALNNVFFYFLYIARHFRPAPLSSDSDQEESGLYKVLPAVSKDGEFRNWAGTVQTSPEKVLHPKSVKDVQDLLAPV